MSRYCGDGLLRFVDGRYAWAVALGLMVGYARSGYTLPDHVEEHLQAKSGEGRR